MALGSGGHGFGCTVSVNPAIPASALRLHRSGYAVGPAQQCLVATRVGLVRNINAAPSAALPAGTWLRSCIFHRPTDGIRILSPTANSACGFPEALFQEGLRRNLHVIAANAGSSDQGPYYPGTDVCLDGKLRETAGSPRGIPRHHRIGGRSGSWHISTGSPRSLERLRQLDQKLRPFLYVALS